MGKAKELSDDLLAHPLTPEEIAEKRRPIGRLQLRADVPKIETAEATPARDCPNGSIGAGEKMVALAGTLARSGSYSGRDVYMTLVQKSFALSPPRGRTRLQDHTEHSFTPATCGRK